MNQTALRSMLRAARAAIDPATVGLPRPEGRGRRAEGLTQHQIDDLTTRAANTYQRFETGNWANVPDEYLRTIAELFGMNEHEWIALNRYALGQDPTKPLSPDSGHRVAGAWQEAVDQFTGMAYVTDCSWNLLAANKACAGLFPSGQVPDNTLRWMLLSREARHILTDWETAWAPFVLPQLRAALSTRQDDAVLRQIEVDVYADPTARAIYDAKGVNIHPDGDERPLHHATHGPGWVTMCSATPEGSPGARLMLLLFQPGNRRTRPRTPLRATPAPS